MNIDLLGCLQRCTLSESMQKKRDAANLRFLEVSEHRNLAQYFQTFQVLRVVSLVGGAINNLGLVVAMVLQVDLEVYCNGRIYHRSPRMLPF
jgi:hypothetical protein